jgi:DNA-binding NarL/FixJ family response regulator
MLTQTQATTKNGSEDTDRRAMSSRRTRLLVVDDHPAVRLGLRQLLEDQPDFNVVGVVETAEDALAVAESHPIDVAIVDYQLGGRNGLWVSRKLKRLQEPPQVVIYSAYASGHLAASCVIAEADGLVSKGGLGSELCDAIRSVARGRCHLPRVPSDLADLLRQRLDSKEQAIFGMLLAGIPRVEMAQTLGSSRAGLESHAAAMLGKLEALPGEVVDLEGAGSSARLHPRLDIQASARRLGASVTVPEDPAVSARRPVAERPGIRRGPAQPTRTAKREAPVRRDSSAAPAPLVHGERPSRVPASPTVELPESTSDEASDSGRGLLLFFTFVTAILVMVLAVWLAAAVGQWWILIPVVAVDLIATTTVMGVVIWMLADGANPAQADTRSLKPITGLDRDPDSNKYAHEPAHAA